MASTNGRHDLAGIPQALGRGVAQAHDHRPQGGAAPVEVVGLEGVA